MANYEWEVDTRTSAVPVDTASIDRVFDETLAASPEMFSSGWIYTLTIECGTLVCACR